MMVSTAMGSMLIEYKRWADKLFLDSVAELPTQELTREHAGPIKTIIAVLNHMYVVDRIWQAHLEGREHGFTSRQAVPYPELSELRQAQLEIDNWLVDWYAGQTEATLARSIDFSFISGNRGSMSAEAMILHLVNHATYHRGWLVQMYFEIPAMPPMTDLCVYLTEAQQGSLSNC